MKIVIIGGTGLVGQKLAKLLVNQNHQVVVASPSTGVDTVTKKGLDKALEKAQVVVDVSYSPSLENQAVLEFFIASNKNLLAAEKRAGIHHHIALSIVGVQNLGQSVYFRGKIAQEELIKSSKIPFTLVYASPFFESIGEILDAHTVGSKIILPKALVRPIALDDVTQFLMGAIMQSEVNSSIEITGPETYSFAEWVLKFRDIHPFDKTIMTDHRTSFFGAPLDLETLLPSSRAKLGEITLDQWLDNHGTLKKE